MYTCTHAHMPTCTHAVNVAATTTLPARTSSGDVQVGDLCHRHALQLRQVGLGGRHLTQLQVRAGSCYAGIERHVPHTPHALCHVLNQAERALRVACRL